jgi:hypothetical protein
MEVAEKASWDLANIWFGTDKEKVDKSLMSTFSYLKFILCYPFVHKYTLLSMIRSYHYNPEYHRLGGYICPSGEARPELNNRGRRQRRCRHYIFYFFLLQAGMCMNF